MPAVQTAARLSEFEHRGAGTDAERRAAVWLAGELRSPRRDAELETFWCRPNWALAHAWHVLLAVAGSLLAVAHPLTGGALVLIALLSLLADQLTGRSLGRRLTPEHASQNVVSRPVPDPARAAGPPVRLIVTAAYDAPRNGMVTGQRAAALAARGRRLTGGRTPGWLGWLAIELIWLVAVAGWRQAGGSGLAVGVAQLVPTAALVIELGALLELAVAPFATPAGDGSATAVAVALVRALDAAPPARLSVELVLQGAGCGQMLGLARHLRQRRSGRHRRAGRAGRAGRGARVEPGLDPARTIVLGIAPCAAGPPCWWTSDGPLLALRSDRRLVALAQRAARSPDGTPPDSGSGAHPHASRGTGPALPARAAGLPAVTLGGDALTTAAIDPGSLDAVLELALTLCDTLDVEPTA